MSRLSGFLILIPIAVLVASTAAHLMYASSPCGKLVIGADRTLQPILDEAIEIMMREAQGCAPKVVRDYGPTGVIWFKLSVASVFDVYGGISGYSVHKALADDLIERSELVVLGYADLIIYVKRGNPHDIKGLRDLAEKSGLTVAIPHPDYTASGQIIKAMLEEAKSEGGRSLWDVIRERHTVIYLFTASKAPAYVRMGSADVSLTFRTYYAVNPSGLSAVEIEEDLNIYVQPLVVSITTYTKEGDVGREFLEILRREEVKAKIKKLGYILAEELRVRLPNAKVYWAEGAWQ